MHPLEEGDPLEGESQQLLHHTEPWKNLIRAKQEEVDDYRMTRWEQAINATAPNQHAPQKRTHEEIEHEDQPETAVAAYSCRARKSPEVKRQKVELPLVPRQPSCQPPPHLFEGGPDGHSDPDNADEWMQFQCSMEEEDELDESDEAKGQKGKGKKGKSKGKKGNGKGKKGNGRGFKGKSAIRAKGMVASCGMHTRPRATKARATATRAPARAKARRTGRTAVAAK